MDRVTVLVPAAVFTKAFCETFILALTPVAVLMFRFNNPDALLVLLLVAAAYCVTRATERASTRWLMLAGVAIGFGVLTKMGAALLTLPGLALAYLVAAPTGWWRRARQLLAGGVALIVSAGWYLALVAFWPAADRPYIGGSQTNSLLELALVREIRLRAVVDELANRVPSLVGEVPVGEPDAIRGVERDGLGHECASSSPVTVRRYR